MKRLAVLTIGAAAALTAQTQTRVEVFERHAAGPVHTGAAPVIGFVQGEFGVEGKLVTSAPYTAEAVTETIQVLGDGNRIVNRQSAQMARDSEGRTRRDMVMAGLPALAGAEAPRVSFINDPVAGVSYTLDHDSKTARKMRGNVMYFNSTSGGRTTIRTEVIGARARVPASEDVLIQAAPAPGLGPIRVAKKFGGKEESLGKQTIEGVIAEGTRVVDTIPAGEIGNEQPIEIVHERWYSPELQSLVMTRHKDPRIGETTYKLTNIRLGEPLKSLFEPPAEYALKEGEMLAVPDIPAIRRMRDRE